MALHKMKTAEKVRVNVTDHAVVRYLERVKGLDVHEVLNEMIPRETMDLIDLARGSRDDKLSFFSCGRYTLVVRGNDVVTVLSPHMVECPDNEFLPSSVDVELREIPWEGTWLKAAVDAKIQSTLEDEAWKARQEHKATRLANEKVRQMQEHLAKKKHEYETTLAHQQKQHLKKQAEASAICEHVRELLGDEKYEELRKGALAKM